MSENFDRRTRDFSKYDSMSTEQLQEILRLDAHRTDGVEMDTDELFYIMGVLADRRRNDSSYTGKTAKEAYETFQKHYLPKDATTPETRKPIVMPSWIRKAVAVAAALAVIFTATLNVDANGFNLWGKVAQWSQDFFRFEDVTHETEPSNPDVHNKSEYASLQDALLAHKIVQPLAPTWMPAGYSLDKIEVARSPRETSIYAYYRNGSTDISISIRQLIGSMPEDIEKSDDLIEAYESNGVTYYIFSNNKKLQVAWIVEEFEGLIIAQVSVDEMKAILDSI